MINFVLLFNIMKKVTILVAIILTVLVVSCGSRRDPCPQVDKYTPEQGKFIA